MGPVAAVAIPAAISAIGGLFGGASQNKTNKAQIRESRRQYDLDYALRQKANAREQGDYDMRQRSIAATTPMRQDIMKMLMQRLAGSGMMPGASPTPAAAPQGGGLPLGGPQVSGGGAMPGGGGGLDPQMLQKLMAAFTGGGAQ